MNHEITEVTTWYLEMREPGQLRATAIPPEPVAFRQAEIASPTFNRFLYTAVGGHWHWHDRLGWSYAEWMNWLDREQLQTWVLYVRGTPAGYAELEAQAGGNVEITYFGLMREFSGRGLGGYLLTETIRRAWAMNAQRVWVHTCSLDGPHALANYQARGMSRYDERTHRIELPSRTPGPWPGWDHQDGG